MKWNNSMGCITGNFDLMEKCITPKIQQNQITPFSTPSKTASSQLFF